MTSSHSRAPYTLSVGTHLCPEDGACLMEVVSELAGEVWSDAPSCTHPLVAHAARLVNDASSDGGRQLLAGFAPALGSATPYGLLSYPRIAVACTEVAVRESRSLTASLFHHLSRQHLRQLARREAKGRSRWYLAWDAAYRRGPAFRAVEAAVQSVCSLKQPRRDRALRAILLAALDALPARPADSTTVTNNMDQTARGFDTKAFYPLAEAGSLGHPIETGATGFTKAEVPGTKPFISGPVG